MKLLEASQGSQAEPKSVPKSVSIYQQLHSDTGSMSDSNNCSSKNSSTPTQPNGTSSGGQVQAGGGEEEAAIKLSEIDDEFLEFTEPGHPDFLLYGINALRKQGQFCDIKLVVEDNEFPLHRAVLAACSPFLFDFLSCLEETAESQPTYKLKDISSIGFRYLLDYMYTGRLHVPLESVTVVYATAIVLKVESAAKACAHFLSTNLTPANCLGIRRMTKDRYLKQAVDDYIRANLAEITQSKTFYGLQDLQVEVVGLDENISDENMERRLFCLILDWVKNSLNDLKPKLDRLVEKVNVLYLGSDNSLRDCAELEDQVLKSNDDMVQDYKIESRRRNKTPSKNGNHNQVSHNGNGAQPFRKFSLNPEESVSKAEREWSIVATRKTSENAYLAIAIVDGRLMVITLHVRPQFPTQAESVKAAVVPDSPPISSKSRLSPVLRKASITPLTGMGTPRCAMGAVELDGKLVVCGGYERGDCLQTVEAFDFADNKWVKMPSMNRARARFGATVLNGCMYVCGGSDGYKDQSCVEKFDPVAQKWTYVPNMLKERSSHGVATLNEKIYCVGGCEGQRSIAACEVYDPASNKWSKIASLNTARSQTCVCAVQGLLFAIGGTDLWNTLNTVEVYDPEKDEWTLGSILNIARRGASVGTIDGNLVVVGGSDGAQSLVSTEFFDFETNTWTLGPSLTTPRANMSVVTVSSRLCAVGGYSGKKFLATLEWFDLENMEWFGHTPRPHSEDLTRSNGSNSDAEDPTARVSHATDNDFNVSSDHQCNGQNTEPSCSPVDFRAALETEMGPCHQLDSAESDAVEAHTTKEES